MRTLSLKLLFGFALLAPLWGLDREAYARSLEQEGDYYRAIGIWKELRFEAASLEERQRRTQSVVADLWRAGQFDLGLSELSAHPEAPDFAVWKGLFEYRLSRFAAAEATWAGSADLYRGLLLARTARTEEASVLWKDLGLPDPREVPAESRSPLLAAALSAVVPGLGQAYTGHWFDGAQAAAFVGFFGGATWMAWQYEGQGARGIGWTSVGGAITLFFEAANVYGAWQTAGYFNENRQQQLYRRWEQAVWSHPSSVTAASAASPSGRP